MTIILQSKLAEEFKGQFECLGENTENCRTFSVLLNKELENANIITYKIMFIDSFRFISSSLSSFGDNLSEGLHNNKCPDFQSYLEYILTKVYLEYIYINQN